MLFTAIPMWSIILVSITLRLFRSLFGYRLFEPFDGLGGRGSGAEDRARAVAEQRRVVGLGDDAAAEYDDVAGVLLFEKVDYRLEAVVVRAGEDADADGVGVFLYCGGDYLLGVWRRPVYITSMPASLKALATTFAPRS